MVKNSLEDGNRYQGTDLMNSQKRILLEKFKEMMKKEQGELVYFLNRKDANSQKYDAYQEELMHLTSTQVDTTRKERLEKKMSYIETIQGDILKAIQPLYHELFDKVIEELPPSGYHEMLRDDVRFDLIFGPRDIPLSADGSRDTYRYEHAQQMRDINQQKKNEKATEKRKKNKDKVIPFRDHRLITKENYHGVSRIIIAQMRQELVRYMTTLGLDIKDKQQAKHALEKLFLFILVHTLIEKKLVFETKSLKGLAIDGTIELVLEYFNEKIGEPIKVSGVDIKRKLQSNLHGIEGPLDLSYTNAMIDDIEYRETYLNIYYLNMHGTSVDGLRREIMAEYDSGKGLIEKSFEMLNPMYHVYKQQEEQHQKHLGVLKGYQRKNTAVDPELEEIIKEMEQSLAYAQKKKKEHTIIEDSLGNKESNPGTSLGEIQKRYLKKYRIPTQFHQIFGVVIDKLNNLYKTKIHLIKEAEKNNDMEFERYRNSPQTMKDFHLYMQLLCTNQKINAAFHTKRETKRAERKQKLKHICLDPERLVKQEKLKEAKKSKQISTEQLSLDF